LFTTISITYIFRVVDVENTMPLRALVYIGDSTISPVEKNASTSVSEAIVMKLCDRFLDAGRNITGDNFFTTFPLINRLQQRHTSYVGTIRKNKRDLPLESKSLENRQKGDSIHFYNNDGVTLCSFWDKSKNVVLLVSSMHLQNQVDRKEGKPDMVEFYNSTKSGVDNLNKLVRGYSSQRKCQRWPYAVFFTFVDVAIVAAMKLMNVSDHYHFKLELAYELIMPLIMERSRLPNLKKTVRSAMENIGIDFNVPKPAPPESVKTGRCGFCERKKDRKTNVLCHECRKFICGDHTMFICHSCFD
jgi:hypothetical protein